MEPADSGGIPEQVGGVKLRLSGVWSKIFRGSSVCLLLVLGDGSGLECPTFNMGGAWSKLNSPVPFPLSLKVNDFKVDEVVAESRGGADQDLAATLDGGAV